MLRPVMHPVDRDREGFRYEADVTHSRLRALGRAPGFPQDRLRRKRRPAFAEHAVSRRRAE